MHLTILTEFQLLCACPLKIFNLLYTLRSFEQHHPCSFLLSTEYLSFSVVSEYRSLSHPRLAKGSPDSRLYKTRSPVDIYYNMRTCHNSASSCAR